MNIKIFKAIRNSSMELFNLASKVLLKNKENNSAYTLKAEPSRYDLFSRYAKKNNLSLILFSFFFDGDKKK